MREQSGSRELSSLSPAGLGRIAGKVDHGCDLRSGQGVELPLVFISCVLSACRGEPVLRLSSQGLQGSVPPLHDTLNCGLGF